jgi:hypothetical protein
MKKINCQVYDGDEVSPHVHLQDINIMKKEKMRCEFKISHLEEIISLKLAIHLVTIDI